MSKGLKRALIIAAVAVALIALTTSMAFAWWDSTSSDVNITTNSVASNVKLGVSKITVTDADKNKLVPKGAFTNSTHVEKLLLAGFKTSLSSDSSATAADLAKKVKLTYEVKSFSLDGTAVTDWKNNFTISVNTAQDGSGTAITEKTGELTNGTSYYVFVKFNDSITAATAKTFDAKALKLVIEVKADNRA